MTVPRLNRAGIPVLDPPGENRLPKRCPPALHEWRRVKSRYVETDWIWDVDYYEDEYRCRICGARYTEPRAEDRR